MYDFNTVINRRNTNSVKWDSVGEDIIPMSIADMDFPSPPQIVNSVMEKAELGIYGYATRPDSFYDSAISWYERRHQWKIEKDWICHSPGLVTALSLAVESLTEEGDGIIIQPPVYYPFEKVIVKHNRKLIVNPLKNEHGDYKMDLDDLENKIKTHKPKLIFLCSPHNPVGRVWKKEELKQFGNICLKYNVLVISDEVHADITFNDNKHICFANISEDFKKNSITCIAPSKTFNLAALHTSMVIIPDDELRNKYKDSVEKLSLNKVNPFGVSALEAAYNEGEDWLKDLLSYLHDNLKFLVDYTHNNIPELKVIIPEGTYLIWIDCRKLNMSNEALESFIFNAARLDVRQGYKFGKGGDGFIRMNIACPFEILREGMQRLQKSVADFHKGNILTYK